ncbi:hypothetical protein QBC38DRAFT_234396 [Podospora fimiseda]|uniref:Uncharacterized protein n=1 Tax=Podospora fimiseda TaxID=252190 RepID=A0AAN7BMW0_9PEZI|nr:hypothetical protein QBC38DRAFT_234396 [Podospora fimiseda]
MIGWAYMRLCGNEANPSTHRRRRFRFPQKAVGYHQPHHEHHRFLKVTASMQSSFAWPEKPMAEREPCWSSYALFGSLSRKEYSLGPYLARKCDSSEKNTHFGGTFMQSCRPRNTTHIMCRVGGEEQTRLFLVLFALFIFLFPDWIVYFLLLLPETLLSTRAPIPCFGLFRIQQATARLPGGRSHKQARPSPEASVDDGIIEPLYLMSA